MGLHRRRPQPNGADHSFNQRGSAPVVGSLDVGDGDPHFLTVCPRGATHDDRPSRILGLEVGEETGPFPVASEAARTRLLFSSWVGVFRRG